MIVELLPSHSREPDRLQVATSFLINRTVAVDAGSLGYALSGAAQVAVRRIVITHTHSDHVGSLSLFVAEVFPLLDSPIEVYAAGNDIEMLRTHVFNGYMWPDFERIRLINGSGPALTFVEIEERRPFEIGTLRFTAYPANHIVPTMALIVEEGESAVLFTSDTYSTQEMWEAARELDSLKCVYAHVAYPGELEDLAARSKHFTPRSLAADLEKLARDDIPILAVHLKPQFREQLIRELDALGQDRLTVGRIGQEYTW